MAMLSIERSVETNRQVEGEVLIEATFTRCCQAFFRFFMVRCRGDEHLVDDLMQQLWLRARLCRDDLRTDRAEPWLWRIAQNLLREHWRRTGKSPYERIKVDPALARELAERFDTEELPAEQLSRREIQDQLMLSLTTLSSEEQELLIGFYFDGRPHVELAEMLGITERAVEGRLYRARLALRRKLSHLEM